MLDNLCEVSLFIDVYSINLIREAFDGEVPERVEAILKSLEDK